MRAFKIVVFVMFLFSFTALAHMENKPGPHKGNIRMPGAFHTEVVAKKNAFDIFLLDINLKMPTIKNSTLTARIKSGDVETKLDCKADKTKFICKVPNGTKTTEGQLLVDGSRDLSPGTTAIYDLPLKY